MLLFGLICHSAFAEEVEFNRDVRPILSDKCYFCHGPDAENREADLRLDQSDGARDVLESGELVRRIMTDDPDERMPPPDSKISLSAEDKAQIKQWVASGAKYESHWAFRPLPATVEVPKAQDDHWSRQPLDRFIQKSLAERKLSPSPSASPLRWLRRVTLDLTGLPPTLGEIDEFQHALETQDDTEVAYRDVVDRLLASPAYGEHMAVAWLDAARYADSYGYQSDRLNTQWPYRDWVVKAFNENLAYDQFLTWQLAGDLLDSPTSDQRLATAFNRIHRLNNEGGAVFEEWRIENVSDRVHTFGTALLGLTLECCRCHDHKYDPISMRDYYSLSAFFNSIDESGVYDNSEKVPAPFLMLPTEQQSAELDRTEQSLAKAEAAYQDAAKAAAERFRQWDAAAKPLAEIPDLIRSLSFDVPYDKSLKEIYYAGSGDANVSAPLDTIAVADSALPRVEPRESADGAKILSKSAKSPTRQAVRLDGERGIVMPGIEPFDRWTPFSLVLNMQETQRSTDRAVIAQCSRGQLTFNGWDLNSSNGYLELRMYRVWPGNAIAVRTVEQIPLDEWVQVSATYDGSSQAAGLKIFMNGVELKTKIVRDSIKKQAMVKVMHGGKLTIGQRFRDRGLAGGLVDDVRVYGRALTHAELTSLATGEPLQPTVEYFASAIDQDTRKAFDELNEARKALVMAEEVVHSIPVMDELPEQRETHLLARGAYDAPTSDETRVTRKTFDEIGPEFPQDASLDRLGLARWVTLPDHPLTSRVIVNRLWGNFFGHGLVRTPDNFGLQGELPTHPQLLDWLARDFIDHGWDIKRFCRNVALSATYRQDSRASQELATQDPENRWLARGPAYRLSSEQIRDLALASSGLLNNEQGGPPVSPYQAGGDLWRESNSMSPAYKQSVGEDLYRRSLYSVWKRTAPLPNMVAFDSESREVCIVKRSRTNTPLQALVLLNDVQFVEVARTLAERTMQHATETPQQIDWMFRQLTGRAPDEQEARVLASLFAAERDHYAKNATDANELIHLGESKPAESLDQADLAAMTVVCQTVLNLDATVWKR